MYQQKQNKMKKTFASKTEILLTSLVVSLIIIVATIISHSQSAF